MTGDPRDVVGRSADTDTLNLEPAGYNIDANTAIYENVAVRLSEPVNLFSVYIDEKHKKNHDKIACFVFIGYRFYKNSYGVKVPVIETLPIFVD